MNYKTLFLIILFVGLSVQIYGQEKFNAYVFLDVQHQDTLIENEMESYIARELRSLGDITLITNPKTDEAFTITVLMAGGSLEENKRKGSYAVSVTISKRSRCNTMYKNADGTPLVMYYDDLKDEFIFVISSDGLKSLGQQIVALVDSNVFKSARKVFLVFEDYKKKSKPN